MSDDELYYGDFESDGEAAVRNNVALKRYQGKKADLAAEWLARKDQSRKQTLQNEQTAATARAVEAAERAADAAERQAATAERANRTAVAALIVSIIAAILSLIAMVR